MESMACPSCGSPHFRKTSAVEYVCEHCHTRFKLSDNQGFLIMIKGVPCPQCGRDNDEDVRFCQHCGAVLVKKCDYCGVETQADRKFCGNCGRSLFVEVGQVRADSFDLLLSPGSGGDYRRIDTIKLIRRLNNNGLAEAKQMSEVRGIVAYELAPRDAEKLKAEFESYGARAELVPSRGRPAVPPVPPAPPKKEGCFIATAAMGDYDHPDVFALRMLRDRQLLCSAWGRGFVSLYYRLSPRVAGVIAGSLFLRRLVFVLLVRPLAGLSRRLNG